MIEKLILAFPRVEIYKELFSSSPRFNKILVLVYQDIIKFCLDATKLGKRNLGVMSSVSIDIILMVRVFQSAWKGLENDFEYVLNRMEEHSKELEMSALAEFMKDIRARQECTSNL
jgi:hypothetical protein